MDLKEPRLVALKIIYNGEIHRIRINLGDFHFSELQELFKKTFHIEANEIIMIQYKDNEGDSVAINNEEEYMEAIKSYLMKDSTTACLRFQMVTCHASTQSQFQEQITKPLVQALEKLIEQLQNTVHLLKNQDWKNKYDKSVETADQMIQNAKETMKSAKQNIQENIKDTPLEQIIRDTGDGFKAAVDGINGFAKELIEEVKNMQNQNSNLSEPSTIVDVESNTNKDVDVDATVVDTNSQEGNIMLENDDWQKVIQDASISNQVQSSVSEVCEAPAVVIQNKEDAQGNDVTETVETVTEAPLDPNVAIGVNLICEVFPACGKQAALRLLAESNNNVEVVLNRLAEEGY